MISMLGRNGEEYLEAIYSLIEEGRKTTPSEIAKRLKVKPSSATEMLKKLDLKGFVIAAPYKPVELTEKGYARASGIKRKHRLLERFLHDSLNISKKRVHEEACLLEHALSDEATESLSGFMHNPRTCPDDGKVIPTAEEVKKAAALSGMHEGQKATVAYLDGGLGFKEKVRSVGIREGKTVEVVTKEPFGGPLVVKIDNKTTISIGRGMASRIRVINT